MGRRSSKNLCYERGVALLLALIGVAIAATLALSFLSAQSTSVGIARNLQNHSAARHVAESGLELAIAYVRANSDWRTVQSHGTWVADEPFAPGTFTIVGEDGEDRDGNGVISIPAEGDGDLSDSSADPLTLTVAGKVNGATHVVRAVITTQLDASFIGESLNDKSGKSIAGVGDVNGDGFDDLIIGAEGDDTGGNDAGKTYLILGKATGWTPDASLSTADASFAGENQGDKAGKCVTGVGDVNGDGFSDFAIGAEDEDTGGTKAGKTYLVLGKAAGWTPNVSLSAADASFIGENANDKSGKCVAGVGDVNGDGFDDFVIGAEGEDTGGSKAGKVYLILGKVSGWTTNVSLSSADASFIGENANDKAGKEVAGVGDVNGDGFDDFVVAAKDAPDDTLGTKVGESYLILGKGSGWATDVSLATADASFVGENAGDKAGEQVTGMGDVNGDGFDDFLIGSPDEDSGGSKAGKTYLILGSATGWTPGTSLSTASASFLGENANDKSAKGLAMVGDVTGDGFADFIIGAEGEDTGGTDAGKVYLIPGKAAGWTTNVSLSTAIVAFVGENTNHKAGKSVAGISDVNGDGLGDFAIGVEKENTGGNNAGKTYLQFGWQGTAGYSVRWTEGD